jgi:hypothetical protein
MVMVCMCAENHAAKIRAHFQTANIFVERQLKYWLIIYISSDLKA